MRQITADYQERIVVPPEDVIPKSSWFKFVKCSLVVALSMLVVLAVITLIVAESFASSPKHSNGLAIGIVSLVGIILFLVGMIAIMKEHIPLVLTFSVAMIIYLLLFMYSRVITSPGLILLRTFILLLLAVESFCFCIMIRDWQAIQISRLNQRMMKEAQLAAYAQANGLMLPHHHHLMMNQMYGPGHPMYGQPIRQQMIHGQQQYGMQHQQQQYMQTQLHHPGARGGGYPEHQLRPYQDAPIMSRSQQQHQQQQYGSSNQALNASSHGYGQANQYRSAQYGPNNQYESLHHHDQNPYIMVEDENPYAQIGEPTRRGAARDNNTGTGHIYSSSRVSQPRRY